VRCLPKPSRGPFSLPLFTGVRGRVKNADFINRSSADQPSANFALLEFSGVRVRQDGYSRLYEP
jgi:hypothetical protein